MMLSRLAVMTAVAFTAIAAQNENCSSEIPNCLRLKTGYYSNGGCCSKYWGCAGNKLFKLECDPGFYFNSGNNQCDDRENATNCVRNDQEKPECKHGSYVAHISGCRPTYWLCSSGELIMKHCPMGTFFNALNDSCELKDLVPGCTLYNQQKTTTVSATSPAPRAAPTTSTSPRLMSSSARYSQEKQTAVSTSPSAPRVDPTTSTAFIRPTTGDSFTTDDAPERSITTTTNAATTASTMTTTPSSTTSATVTVLASKDSLPAARPVMVLAHHKLSTFLGVSLLLFSILCLLYLLCGTANCSCSASVNLGSAASPDSMINVQFKKVQIDNVI